MLRAEEGEIAQRVLVWCLQGEGGLVLGREAREKGNFFFFLAGLVREAFNVHMPTLVKVPWMFA